MREDFLHYVWQFVQFDTHDLRTTDGTPLAIVAVGERHTDSGPDFRNARIRIGETMWAGNVEIHTRSSDWHRHHHSGDRAYENVILHVVGEDDERQNATLSPAYPDGRPIPCLVLEGKIRAGVVARYYNFMKTAHSVPCHALVGEVSELVRTMQLERALVERLERRTTYLLGLESIRNGANNWEEAFWQALARSFGAPLNSEPMEQVARSLPVTLLAKNRDSRTTVEALLLGQAGFLEGAFEHPYPQALQKEYQYQQKKHQLSPVSLGGWRTSRMRPANFPTVRLAQLADLVIRTSLLFSKTLEATELATLETLFTAEAAGYWTNHYTLEAPNDTPHLSTDATTTEKPKRVGKVAVQSIIINTVVPFLFAYGTAKNEDTYRQRALRFLSETKPEQNSVLRVWEDIGFAMPSAYETQALLELQKHYCDCRRCLECSIGNVILSTEASNTQGKEFTR